MKKNFSVLISGLLLLALVDPALPQSAKPDLKKVVVGTSSPGLFEFPVTIALEKGFFRDEGIEPLMVRMSAGTAVQATIAGNVDYNLMPGASGTASLNGAPVRIVMGIFTRPLHVLVARKEITSFRDLKGKTIGISSFGATADVLVRLGAMHFNMDPSKDVFIVQVGGSSARFAALQSGSIDATPLDIAYLPKAEKMGFKTIVDFADLFEAPVSAWVTTDKKIRENPQEIKQIIRATLKGIEHYKRNKDEVVKRLASDFKIDDAGARFLYETSLRSLTRDGTMTETGTELFIQQSKTVLKMTKEIGASQVMDWSLVRQVRKEAEIR